ncbi:DDE superfamily endonuclease [Hirsutella rhossiliensis]
MKLSTGFRRGAGIMHQIALLKSENRILREENEILSRRGKAKSRVSERREHDTIRGQDLQAQNEMDAQLRQEMRQNGGRKSRRVVKEQRCGVCGKTGHNARNCEIVVEMSEEDDSD